MPGGPNENFIRVKVAASACPPIVFSKSNVGGLFLGPGCNIARPERDLDAGRHNAHCRAYVPRSGVIGASCSIAVTNGEAYNRPCAILAIYDYF
jgi:hypothetical protein